MMTPFAVISGIGTCLPPRSVSNDELSLTMDTSDTWIRRRTGIAHRRWVDPGTSTGDLAVAAGGAALASARSTDVDLLVLATTTPDRHCPATAPEVAARIGLAGVCAFDLSAACSGFVYALAMASSAISSGAFRGVLVIGADTYSTIINPRDRETAVIFGDGAGAVVLRAGTAEESGAVYATDLGSDGTRSEFFEIPVGGSRCPDHEQLFPHETRYVTMRGRELYVHAVRRMTDSSRRTLASTGWQAKELGAFIAHQANQRILDAVSHNLGIPGDRAISHLAQVGNTAAASVPLALAHAVTQQITSAGDKALLTAFGAGLTWGTVAITWPDATPIIGEPAPALSAAAMPPLAPKGCPVMPGGRAARCRI